MPAKLPEWKVGRIVVLRGLDHDKTEIAEELDISRKTVTRKLDDVRDEYEEEGDGVLLRYILLSIVRGEPSNLSKIVITAFVTGFEDALDEHGIERTGMGDRDQLPDE